MTKNNTPAVKSKSIMSMRWRNFKKIKRAYLALIIIAALYIFSFLTPLFISNKALLIKYNNEYYAPALADLYIPVGYYEGAHFGQDSVFGKTLHGEPHYRELKKTFASENKGNWVLMPPYPYSPVENMLSELPKDAKPPTAPDATHIFGTDNRGRDVLARLIYGFQISITFALIVTILSYIIGIFVGGILGYYGGKIDIYGSRFIEIISYIPFLFVMMILGQFLRPNIWTLAILDVLLGSWIGITYFMRGEFYREKSRDYTAAAVAMGASDFQIMFKHILPNALTPIITFAPFAIISNISLLVALDFLGFGLRPPTPSWGELISQGTSEDISNWWLIVAPLSAMFFTLLSITFIGEGIRQAFDPREYSRLR